MNLIRPVALAALLSCIPGTAFAQDGDSRPQTPLEVLAQAGVTEEEAETEAATGVSEPGAPQLEPGSVTDGASVSLESATSASDFNIDLEKLQLDKLYEMREIPEPGSRVAVSLEEVIQLALEQNQDIEVALLDPLRSDGQLLGAKGAFDPVLQGQVRYFESSAQANSQTVAFGGISAIENYTTTLSAGIVGNLHWGTQYNVTLSMDDEESTFNDFIEEWSGSLQATVTQPLLRGAGRTANMAQIWQAENARYQSEEVLRLTVMQTLGDVIKAYWDLAGSVENVRVRRKSVDNAERLLEITRKRLDIGTASPLDVVQAQAGVATRQSDLISAQSLVADTGDQLKRLANIQDDGRLSGKLLMPVDRPSPEPVLLDVDASIDAALAHRPEVRTSDIAIANAEIGVKEARNGLLPQVDLQGSVSRGGRDHKPRQVFYGIRDNNDHTWSVGLTGSLPLRNRSARGQYHVAEIGLEEAELRKEQTIQDLILQVRMAARAVDTNQFLVESNRQTRLVQETNLKAEERRLTLGLTTNFQILEVEEDLTTAEVAELRAMIELEKSLVDLALAEGVLLERLGIDFTAPEPRRPTNYFRGIVPFVNPRAE